MINTRNPFVVLHPSNLEALLLRPIQESIRFQLHLHMAYVITYY